MQLVRLPTSVVISYQSFIRILQASKYYAHFLDNPWGGYLLDSRFFWQYTPKFACDHRREKIPGIVSTSMREIDR